MDITKLFIELLNNLLKERNFVILPYIIILIAFIALYKAFRESYIKNKSLDTDFIKESIDMHIKSIIVLDSYLSNKIYISKVLDTLALLYKYAQPKTSTLITNYIKEKNFDDLKDLYIILNEDLEELKRIQIMPHKKINSNFSYEKLEYMFMDMRFDNLIMPLFYSFFTFLIILIFFLIILNTYNKSGYILIFNLLRILLIFIGSSFVIFSYDFLKNKTFSRKKFIIPFSLLTLSVVYLIKTLDGSGSNILSFICSIYCLTYLPILIVFKHFFEN